MKNIKKQFIQCVILFFAVIMMAMGCREEVKKNCQTEKCEEINIKSTHTDIAARIYDRSHIEVEEPDYVIVYSRAFVENKNF